MKLRRARADQVVEKEVEGDKEESFLKFFFSFALSTVIVLGGIAVIAGVAGSVLGYYRVDTVLSGSMRPVYNPGDVVVAFQKDKEAVQTGDVLIFKAPEQYGGATVTHRVLSARLTESGEVYIRTKGDANNAPDPWEARVTSPAVWEVEGSFPYVGYVAYYANQYWPLLLAFAVAIPMMSYANNRVREVYGKAAWNA